jgi:hypothetical protein
MIAPTTFTIIQPTVEKKVSIGMISPDKNTSKMMDQ